MDKYKGCNKLFFCCSDASKLQPPIKHLCKIINLKPALDKEIVEILEIIADQEGVGFIEGPLKILLSVGKSPGDLSRVGSLKNLIEHDVSLVFIFNTLMSKLKQHVDEHFQLKVNAWDKNGKILNEEKKRVGFTCKSNEESGKKLTIEKRKCSTFQQNS